MTNISNFQTIASQVEKGLVKKDTMRDKLLKLSREIIKNSGQSIESFHRQDFEQSKKKLQLAEDLVNKISIIIKEDILYQQIGIIDIAMQEYAEAKLLYELIKGDKLLPLDEINVNEQSYLLGVADLIGELRRYILEKLVENKIEEAKKYYGIMKEIYGTILQIDYGKNLVPEFRRKKDTARVLVERTLSDLFVALQGEKFKQVE